MPAGCKNLSSQFIKEAYEWQLDCHILLSGPDCKTCLVSEVKLVKSSNYVASGWRPLSVVGQI